MSDANAANKNLASVPMTDEMQQLVNDPSFVVEFAIGDPFPDLVPQERGTGLTLSKLYFDEPKRYVMKKAHMSTDDVRVFDYTSRRVVLVSHHPGKNPYEKLDPLGLTGQGAKYQRYSAGGEWESACDVTSKMGGIESFRIRPKTLSRFGRQYVQRLNGTTVMNIGKMGKFKSMSLRPHFTVGTEKNKDAVYTIVADMVGRTFSIKNQDDQVVAQVAKTSKALITTAAFGQGSESTIDVAPGVDCSAILAIVLGIGQVGKHYVKDSFNSYVKEPIKEKLVEGAVESVPGLDQAADYYTDASHQAQQQSHLLAKTAKFFNDNFFV